MNNLLKQISLRLIKSYYKHNQFWNNGNKIGILQIKHNNNESLTFKDFNSMPIAPSIYLSHYINFSRIWEKIQLMVSNYYIECCYNSLQYLERKNSDNKIIIDFINDANSFCLTNYTSFKEILSEMFICGNDIDEFRFSECMIRYLSDVSSTRTYEHYSMIFKTFIQLQTIDISKHISNNLTKIYNIIETELNNLNNRYEGDIFRY